METADVAYWNSFWLQEYLPLLGLGRRVLLCVAPIEFLGSCLFPWFSGSCSARARLSSGELAAPWKGGVNWVQLRVQKGNQTATKLTATQECEQLDPEVRLLRGCLLLRDSVEFTQLFCAPYWIIAYVCL